MLKRIKSIRNYGVFRDFTPSDDLPDFKKYNLIYGPNGSGKTTVTRIIQDLGTPNEKLEKETVFKFETEDGTFTNKKPYPAKIRVFNTDYVQSNIGEIEGALNHIIVVGEKNKSLVSELEREEAGIEKREKDIAANRLEISNQEKKKDGLFTDVAKRIGQSISGDATRTYKRNNAKIAYENLDGIVIVSDDRLEQLRNSTREQRMPDLEKVIFLEEQYMSLNTPEFPFNALSKLVLKSNEILPRTVQSIVIERLVDETDIAEWVNEGIAIHRKHKSSNCEFCSQSLPEERIRELDDHFSDADQKFKTSIKSLIDDFKKALTDLQGVNLPNEFELYSDYQKTYKHSRKTAEETLAHLSNSILDAVEILSQKIENRTQVFDEEIKVDAGNLKQALKNISDVIKQHNEHTKAFNEKIRTSEKEIEQHFLSEIHKPVSKINKLIDSKEIDNNQLQDGVPGSEEPRSLEQLILSAQGKRESISDSHHAGEKLTSNLQAFLGRNDLKLIDGKDGYQVQRYGEPATRLSEGERTAIAFLYFLIELTDQDFDITDGIVVIDDPISSLDSASIYQAFSFLKNAVKDSQQVFLFTHSHEFLRLLLNWLQYNANRKSTSCYMTYCQQDNGKRHAEIRELDKLLRDYKTEYHFLFKILNEFKNDGTIMTAYHIPNAARKFLETFLSHHDPSKGTDYQKLERVKFDEVKKNAILKFSNDMSHYKDGNFDPSLVEETQKNVGHLMEMVEAIADKHYKGLVDATT